MNIPNYLWQYFGHESWERFMEMWLFIRIVVIGTRYLVIGQETVSDFRESGNYMMSYEFWHLKTAEFSSLKAI